MPSDPDTAELRREVRKLRAHLKQLCARYEEAIYCIDQLFKVTPKTPEERAALGGKVARAMGVLEHDVDAAKHFGLGLPLRKKLWKPKANWK